MRIAWVLALSMAACGGASTQTQTKPTHAPDKEATLGTMQSGDPVARGCAGMAAVHARTSCEFLVKARFSEPGCVEQFRDSVNAATGTAREAMVSVLECSAVASSCDDIALCFGPLTRPEGQSSERTCGDGAFGPLALSADEAAARTGARATKFSEVAATREEPIEVCAASGETAWLTRVTCDDGSNPFGGDRQAAYEARSGSVGGGGRCGHVIDLYEVPCPERTYEIHMDLYMCGPDESF